MTETFELAIEGVYLDGTFVADELCVAYCAVIPELQLRVFFNRCSGATRVLLDDPASSVKNVARVGLFSSRNDDLDLLLRLVRGFDISMIRECRSG
jgi:hypothetical protein